MATLANPPGEAGAAMPNTRGYQLEMLEASLQRNIIIALDTGSGKTHIAVLRIKREIEVEATKLVWFLAPTVTLCKQQKTVVETALPVSVGIISGETDPNQWKNHAIWTKVLSSHRVMISTPQVLLDALRHGYVSLGRDISLLIFDEAHHAVDNHPYNRIMAEFYVPTPPRKASIHHGFVRPMVMGLTASPIFGGNPLRAFQVIEKNLDSTIVTPLRNREELSRFVYRPEFRSVVFKSPVQDNSHFSTNLANLHAIVSALRVEDDPYVHSLRRQLRRAERGSADWRRLDQKLSEVIGYGKSFTHKGLHDFVRTAIAIQGDLGAWAADWYVWSVVDKAVYAIDPHNNVLSSWKDSEKAYLLTILRRLVLTPPSYITKDIVNCTSNKVVALINILIKEKAETEERGDAYSGIVFVQRRDTVIALSHLLENHPGMSAPNMFRVGCLVGVSDSGSRHAFLDITRYLLKDSQDETLMDFRMGDKNLIVSTSVAEEGIDIQACGSVIRWDLPANMASWAQSRGRARRKKSTFTLLFEAGMEGDKELLKWEKMEKQMVELYNDPRREERMKQLQEEDEDAFLEGDLEEGEVESDWVFRVEATGATLTLQSAVPHLSHFCATIPSALSHSTFTHQPIYEIDPPEFSTGWHALDPSERFLPEQGYQGPYGARLTLPRVLPSEIRTFEVPMGYKSKMAAFRRVAWLAYKKLYDVELLNQFLLPLGSGGISEWDGEGDPEDERGKKKTHGIEKGKGMDQMNPWKGLASPTTSTIEEAPASTDSAPDDSASAALPQDTEPMRQIWYLSRIGFDGIAPLHLFTLVPINPPESAEEGPILYYPRDGADRVTPVRASIRPENDPDGSAICIMSTTGAPSSAEDWQSAKVQKAREYTRMLFWAFNGSRMNWEKLDFSYLLLPWDPQLLRELIDDDRLEAIPETPPDHSWGSIREWRASAYQAEPRPVAIPSPHSSSTLNDSENATAPTGANLLQIQARLFGEQYNYPSPLPRVSGVHASALAITFVRPTQHFGKGYRFVSWRYENDAEGPLTQDEEAALWKRYKKGWRREKEKRLGASAAETIREQEDAPVDEDAAKAKEEEEKREFFAEQVVWPLMVVEPWPARTNFLIPNSSTTTPRLGRWKGKSRALSSGRTRSRSSVSPTTRQPISTAQARLPEEPETYLPRPNSLLLLPEYTYITLLSSTEIDYAMLLPSILRHVAVNVTASSLRTTLFPFSFSPTASYRAISPSPSAAHSFILDGGSSTAESQITPPSNITLQLSQIPIPLVATAILAPTASERHNYQRLETLGDTLLKFLVGLQLMAEYPLWPEGYLTGRKDAAVCNGRLRKEARREGVEIGRWIIRDRLISKKWRPSYLTQAPLKAPPQQGGSIQPAQPEGQAVANQENATSQLEASGQVDPNVEGLQVHVLSNMTDTGRIFDDVSTPTQATVELDYLQRAETPVPAATIAGGSDQTSPGRSRVTIFKKSTGQDTTKVDVKKPRRKRGKKKRADASKDLSTKMLADVVEALLGASYVFGSFDLGCQCAAFFNLGLKWQSLQYRIQSLLARLPDMPDSTPSENGLRGLVLPRQLKYAEQMIGYEFKHKALLVEALTHASYQQSVGEFYPDDPTASMDPSSPYTLNTISYERLEFLGDSILDMIVTDRLFRAPGKEYSPGHMHQRKAAVVNGQVLAFICLRTKLEVDHFVPRASISSTGLGLGGSGGWGRQGRAQTSNVVLSTERHSVYLWQCLLHSSPRILEDQDQTCARFRKHGPTISKALEESEFFPYAGFTRLQAPKFFSDIIESLIGAVFLDACAKAIDEFTAVHGNRNQNPKFNFDVPPTIINSALDAVRQMLSKDYLGLLPILDRIIDGDVDVLHPVSRLALWAGKHQRQVDFEFMKENGMVTCMVLIDGKEEVRVTDTDFGGKARMEEVKYLAAEDAIKALKLRDGNVNKKLLKKLERRKRSDIEF